MANSVFPAAYFHVSGICCSCGQCEGRRGLIWNLEGDFSSGTCPALLSVSLCLTFPVIRVALPQSGRRPCGEICCKMLRLGAPCYGRFCWIHNWWLWKLKVSEDCSLICLADAIFCKYLLTACLWQAICTLFCQHLFSMKLRAMMKCPFRPFYFLPNYGLTWQGDMLFKHVLKKDLLQSTQDFFFFVLIQSIVMSPFGGSRHPVPLVSKFDW